MATKLKRSYYALYINTNFDVDATTPATPVWQRIGDDIEEASMELNHDVETTKNILDETKSVDNGYEPTFSVDTFYAADGDNLYAKLKGIISERKTGSDLNTEILEVWIDDLTDTSHTALKSKVMVSVESYGGDTSGFNIPFTITQNGAITKGTAALSGWIPTFTPAT